MHRCGPKSGANGTPEHKCAQWPDEQTRAALSEYLLTESCPSSIFEAVKFSRGPSLVWGTWGTAIPTRNNCSFQSCSSTGRVKNEHRKALDTFEILILFIATQRPMKSAVTAWKAENLPYNVQLPVLHVVFLLLLSRLGGRQKLGWPLILSHERCEQWLLCIPSSFVYFRTSKKIRTDFRNISSWTRKM